MRLRTMLSVRMRKEVKDEAVDEKRTGSSVG